MVAQAKTISFGGACQPGKRITVAVTGDLLFHRKLQAQAYRKGSSFKRFFTPVRSVLAAADVAYGNLEGPAAVGVAPGGRAVKDTGKRLGKVYGAPLRTLSFNYHPSVIPDLAESGFDVLSTANNHSLDRGVLGVERTIDALLEHKMAYTGTRKRDEVAKRWSVITRTRNIAVAWLACTYSTNGIPDRKKLVRHCYKEKDAVLSEIRDLKADPEIDAIFLTPHWGVENRHKPRTRQKKLARLAIEAGATAVLGAHPHVLQPWEKVVTKDNREGLIIYSSGNFISNQRRTPQRAGAISMLELVKTIDGKVQLASAGFMPTWVEIDGDGHRVTFNDTTKGRRGRALKDTLRLLPKGNRMHASLPFEFPAQCEGRPDTKFSELP